MTETRTNKQNTQFYSLLLQLKLQDRKAEIVSSFTQNRTERSSEMTVQEMELAINWLRNQLKQTQASMRNKLRRKILSICYELGWTTEAGTADFAKLQGWIEKKGKHKEPFNSLSIEQLNETITQLNQILQKEYGKK